MTSKRSRLEIIYDLLNAIHEKGGNIKPTHLLYKSNLSHDKMKKYVEELAKQKLLEKTERKGKKAEMVYPHQIDRNCLPHCDDFTENDYTKEEMKLVNET